MPAALLVPALALPALWLGASVANAHASGWARLARLFGTQRPPSALATDFGRQPGRVGAVSMRGSLGVCAEPDGLRLSVPGLLRPGRPPLLLPWDELEIVGTTKQDAHPLVTLAVGADRLGTVAIPTRVARQIPELGLEADASPRPGAQLR